MGAGPSVRKVRESEESSSLSSGYFGAVDTYTKISCEATWTDVLHNYGLTKFCDLLFVELEAADIDTCNKFHPIPKENEENVSRYSMVTTMITYLLSIEDTNYATKLRASKIGKFHLRLGIKRYHMQKFCMILIKTLMQVSRCMLVHDTMFAWTSLTQWALDAMYVTSAAGDSSSGETGNSIILQIDSSLPSEAMTALHHRQTSGKSEVFSRMNSELSGYVTCSNLCAETIDGLSGQDISTSDTVRSDIK